MTSEQAWFPCLLFEYLCETLVAMTAGPKCEVENSMQDESVGFVFALQSHLRTFRCVQAECFFPTCMLFSTECKVKHKIMTR